MRPSARHRLFGRAQSLVGFALLTAMVWAPSVLACPVCGTTKEESRLAFILMTGFLTVMPLLLIGVAIFVAARRLRAAEAQESDEGAAGDLSFESPEGLSSGPLSGG